MDNSIIIGKFTLESLTNGMYATCLDLYREYVQNAADSLDDAIVAGIITKDDSDISITVDSKECYISVYDNGTGIKSSEARNALLDVGNSKKLKKANRGFRGIGRLAALGYCDKLIFTTSYKGERCRTIVEYDAKLLKMLLHLSNEKNESMHDVLEAVTTVKIESEKESTHYFKVELIGVDVKSPLLVEDKVKEYLVQNLPLEFSSAFQWGDLIKTKIKHLGYSIPSYNVHFSMNGNSEILYKKYQDSFVSDRVRKYTKKIEDIEILPIKSEGKLMAILWYAKTDYSGTVLDGLIKGIRVRQGNMLIGSKSTANQYFKEERFNGWLIGELYVIDEMLIPNARRDDFESTEEYDVMKSILTEWSARISREIRSISYERNTTESQKEIFEKVADVDENALDVEEILFTGEDEEILEFVDESEALANNELFDKFRILLGMKEGTSKYKALNMCNKVTNEQRQTIERVFDVLYAIYPKKKAEKIANDILENI